MTYAYILRKVKCYPELIDLGENVGRIRDLVLELKKPPGKMVENFLGKVEKSLGEEAQVQPKSRRLLYKVGTLMKSRLKRISTTP